MKRILSATAVVLLLTGVAEAQQPTSGKVLKSLPGETFTVTDYYKQNVYDPSDTKIGDIKDVLIDSAGQIKALIIGVGGLLGAGEKESRCHLTLSRAPNANKD